MLIKPGITAEGFRTAVRDYTEPTVVEELCANSYDADASTVLILLDTAKGQLHVIDDGLGFGSEAIERMAVLGAGDKQNVPYSKGNRHYLGSYGYGLKSTLNISTRVAIHSAADEGEYSGVIDWTKLDEALTSNFAGFDFKTKKASRSKPHGTHIVLTLKNPTSKDHLDAIANVLSNLPDDNGRFRCYFGLYSDVTRHIPILPEQYGKLREAAKRLGSRGLLTIASSSANADLAECVITEI